jgi:hypothetical protein
LRHAHSERQRRACSPELEGHRGEDEVGNLTEVGAGLRSGSQVRSFDTLKCREAARNAVFGRSHRRGSKHTRGGLRPDDRIGTPRRGRRSREHRLGCASNRAHPRTDARPEQRPEVDRHRARARRRQRHEGNGRREAHRLVEWEKLWRPSRNPKGGSGVKQSPEAQAGSNR